MIRVAILSFWHVHGKDYANAAIEHPDTTITAVWDENAERGASEAERLGVKFYADLAELLARDDVDAVTVTTPTNLHRDVIIAAARAGKHIFTEKVIAATASETDEILREVEAAGVAFMVSMWRSDEAYAHAVKGIIDSGQLGTVTELRVRDGHPFALPMPDQPGGFLPEQFWDPVEAQGGVLIDLCHPVYLTAMLLGMPKTVSATFGHVTGRPVEDNAVVSMGFANGAIAIAETTSASRFTPFSIEVHGTEGSLLFSARGIGEMVAAFRDPDVAEAQLTETDSPAGVLLVRSNALEKASNVWERLSLPEGEWPKAFTQWVRHIEAGTRAPANVALGRNLSTIIEAAYASSSTQSHIEIADLGHAD